MRPGQNKRMRGRPNNGGGNRKGPNPLTRSYESNGPDVKIRGNAHHVAEKYLQLARDAQSSGDPVAAESYLQHAEHYFRLIASAQAAQAGYARQPDAVDTEGEDDDDSGLPDRFASPQAPAPFVPQPAPQPYGGERPAYNGERQPYGGQNGQGGERQPYNGQNGERPPYGDRNNGRQDRQDRNGMRRPYRDNAGEIRTDDRQPGQEQRQDPRQDQRQDQRQDRPYGDRPYGERGGEPRLSRRERFALERQERMDRNGGDRAYGDRGFDRPRDGSDRYRDPQGAEPPADFGSGEQPRIEAAAERQPEPPPQPAPEPVRGFDPAPAGDEAPEAAPARAEAPRRRERAASPAPEEAPGLPSFITTPTRVTPAAEAPAPNLATATAFPGDDAEEAPKFPRRRRRTPRTAAAAEGEAPAAGADQPASGD